MSAHVRSSVDLGVRISYFESAVENRSQHYTHPADALSLQEGTVSGTRFPIGKKPNKVNMNQTRLFARLMVLSLGVLVVPPASGQGTSGRVVGTVAAADDGSPLSGTTVQVVGSSRGGLTDDTGRYRLDNVPLGTISLRFTRLGFSTMTQTVTVVAGGPAVVNVRMGSGPIALDALHVLLERTRMLGDPLDADELPGAAHILDRKALEAPEFVYDNVHEMLRRIPGVNVQEEDGFGLRPNIGLRGTGVERSSKITLMEDGVLIAPAPYAAPAAYYFPVAGRMEAVEVRKGSSQVKYGPRTIGGAINLVSSSIPEKLTWTIDAAGGENGTLKTQARVGSSSDHFGWMVEGYRIETDGFKRLTNGAPTGFDVEDFVGKFRINTDREATTYQQVELKVGFTDEVSNETYLGLTDTDFALNPFRRYAASQFDVLKAGHSQVQVRHFLARGRLDLTTTLYRNDFSRNWYKLQSVRGTGINSVLAAPATNAEALAILKGASSDADDLKIRANNREYFGQGIQWTAGLRLEDVGHDLELGVRFHQDQEDRFQWEDGFRMNSGAMVQTSAGAPGSQSNRVSTANAIALYLQDEIDLGRLVLVPGLRFESIDMVRTDFAGDDPTRATPTRVRKNQVDVLIPGVGFSYQAGDGAYVFGGVHKGFGPPGPGATGAKAEESWNYEVGARYRDRGLAAQATGFVGDYSNILGRATLANSEDGSGDTFNGGAVGVVGLEAAADYDLAWGGRPGYRLPLRISYTYTRAEFKTAFESNFEPWGAVQKGDRLPYLPEHQWSGSFGVESPVWGVSVSAVASGAMRTKAGQGPILDESSTDSFLVFNLSGEYRLAGLGTAYAALQNVTNRRYGVARRPAGLRPGLPRTLLAGFKITR
ncbi:MAG: TonB-dependent receptor [Gemmatimonadota bacterium]|nr:MAG: TonB-dependent receptor [Gemmatimonadota bacterium]